MEPVRVLIVEDFAPFRRFIRSTLEKTSILQIIGEVDDGLEAVRKAEELQPGLILMDVGLPSLSGIEAARRISKLVPNCRMLFVSQESSADVVREAFRCGAIGYVVKTYAGSELLLAVETILQGTQFVSSGVSGDGFSNRADRPLPDRPARAPRPAESTRNHKVQFFSDEVSFLTGFARFIESGLQAGNAVILIATESHRAGLFQELQSQGLDIDAAIQQGTYVALDVADTLASFMVNDLPDPVRFHKITSDLLAAATRAAKGPHPRVSACGECAPFLWAQGNSAAALRLERLCDQLARTCDLDILCGYIVQDFEREHDAYQKICAEHSAVDSDEPSHRSR
jgi:DNA-binding NarL/FixJ family response regulator